MAIHHVHLSKKELSDLEEGKLFARKLGKKTVCIGKAGKRLFGVSDKCPHAGGSLSSGTLNEKGEIVCPVHRYRFDYSSGKSTDDKGFAIRTYKIEQEPLVEEILEIEIPDTCSLKALLNRKNK